MKRFDIFENGIYMQFSVNEEGYLSLYNFSSKKVELSSEDEKTINGHWVTEVQIAGASSTVGKHIGHQCPTIPKYLGHTDIQNDKGRLIVITLGTSVLEIKQYYQFYNGTMTVCAWAEVKNVSEKSVGLEYVSSFCYSGFVHGQLCDAVDNIDVYIPHNSWSEELNIRKTSLRDAGFNSRSISSSSNRLKLSSRGNWPTKEYLPIGLIGNKISGDTYFWQIEVNGSWSWELGDLSGNLYLRLSGPCDSDHSWYKVLERNETFISVPAAVTVTGMGFDHAVSEMTKYRRLIVNKGILDHTMPVTVNDYMHCLLADPTTEKVLPVVESAAELGAEIYCMDAGWYSTGYWWPLVGEWEICEERFKGGLKAIFDRIKELGMKGGIWLEPEVMGIDCPLVPEFEDCFYTYRGNKIVCNGRYQLDFRKEKVINHLNKVIDNLVEHLGVSYFKFDYNIDTVYGTETDADSCGDGLMRAGEAYLKWVDGLYERHPGLMIENCASGGMRMDYRSLKHFALQSVSDAAFYDEFAHMSVMAPIAVIPEQAGIWVVTNNENTIGQNAIASINAMLNRMYISGRIDVLEKERFESLKESVRVYKEIRNDLKNSLPIFPCGICHYESDWMIGGRVTENKDTVYISAVNMRSDDEQKSIRISECKNEAFDSEIIYPEGIGEAMISNGILNARVPKKSGILIKLKRR